MGLLSGFDNSTGWAILQKNTPAIETAYASTTSSASDIAYFKSVASPSRHRRRCSATTAR